MIVGHSTNVLYIDTEYCSSTFLVTHKVVFQDFTHVIENCKIPWIARLLLDIDFCIDLSYLRVCGQYGNIE